MAVARKDRLPGGLADKYHLNDFDVDQLSKGLRVELEHTNDPDLALEIAMDHLVEDPIYYDKLALMEQRGPDFSGIPDGSGGGGPGAEHDWEVTFDADGMPVLLKTPRVPHQFGDLPEDGSYKDRGGPFSGDTGSLPSNPNWPIQMDQRRERQPKEEGITDNTLTFAQFYRQVNARYNVQAGDRPLLFNDVKKIVYALFPGMKMVYPQPPTHIWNPKGAAGGDEKGKNQDGGKEDNPEDKLDILAIKNKLKTKLPKLVWTNRVTDGVPQATLKFGDGTGAEFLIGNEGDHLTMTFKKKA